MGTIFMYMICHGEIDWGNDEMSIVGKMFMLIMKIIFLIVSLSLAIVENIFIIPAWTIYNLCHKKQYRKNYVEFLGLKEKEEIMDLYEMIIRRTDFLVMSEYPRDYRDCVRQAVNELVTDEDLYKISQWYGDISRYDFATDMCGVYDRFVKSRISEAWHKESLIKQ